MRSLFLELSGNRPDPKLSAVMSVSRKLSFYPSIPTSVQANGNPYLLSNARTSRWRFFSGCLCPATFAVLKFQAVMNIRGFFKSGGAMKGRLRMLFPLIAIILFPPLRSAMNQPPAAPIYVTLWFDTEDYILPQSDDAAKRLAETLTRLGVRATFKIVGEKARTLERRGRKDVIAALKKHEIGYHSNTHSQQPTIAVYLQHAGWEDDS